MSELRNGVKLDAVPVMIGENMKMHVEVTRVVPADGSAPKDIVGLKQAFDFDDVTAVVKQLSTLMLTALKEAQPTKANVEFGIEVAVESGQLTAVVRQNSSPP